MISLIYVSSAVESYTSAQLLGLLKQARRNNAQNGVTGMLLYKHRKFMQSLEGDDHVVNRLFDKIRRDPRHRDVITVLKSSIHARQFSGWSMGFQDLQEPGVRLVPGYEEFRDAQLSSEEFSTVPSRAQKLLLAFKQNGDQSL